MKQNQFLSIINHYKSIDKDRLVDVISLQKQFPYSQLIRTLAASIARDKKLPNAARQIRLAALYATDRSLLKEIINAPKTTAKNDVPPTPTKEAFETKKQTDEDAVTTPTIKVEANKTSEEINKIIDTLPLNMVKLKEQRLHFETLVESMHNNLSTQKSLPKKVKPRKVVKKKAIKKVPLKKLSKKKLPRVTKNSSSKRKSPSKKINEKSSTKKKSNRKKQTNLIDEFTEKKFSPKKVSTSSLTQDMAHLSEASETLKEGTLSETLAQILVTQGKYDKAIDMMKKLIWKFPQKKDYFTAQINLLKKK